MIHREQECGEILQLERFDSRDGATEAMLLEGLHEGDILRSGPFRDSSFLEQELSEIIDEFPGGRGVFGDFKRPKVSFPAEVLDELSVCMEFVTFAEAPPSSGSYTATGNILVNLLEHQPALLEPPV